MGSCRDEADVIGHHISRDEPPQLPRRARRRGPPPFPLRPLPPPWLPVWGPPQQPPFNEMTFTGRHRRSGDEAFHKGSVA